MVIIRRFECALEEKKNLVVAKFESNPNAPAAILNQISGYPFYNTSRFNLTNLLNDSSNIAENFQSYIEGLLSGKLNQYLHEFDEECNEIMDQIVERMKMKEGVTEELKSKDQMKWVGMMNNIRIGAEEMIVREIMER